MNISIRMLGGVSVVEVSGVLDSHASGSLYDTLVTSIADGARKLAVDLSGIDFLTRAGVRGLIVAAKLLRFTGGEMRICGATRPVEVFLQGLGHTHLLKFDASLEHSLARLSPGPDLAGDMPPESPARAPMRWKIKGFGRPKERPLRPLGAGLDQVAS